MATETELFYGGLITINGVLALCTSWYYFRRLKIEEARSTALEQQRDNLQKYYDARLSVEMQKLSVEREKLAARNGEQMPKRTTHVLPRPLSEGKYIDQQLAKAALENAQEES